MRTIALTPDEAEVTIVPSSPGQRVIVNPAGSLKVSRATVGGSKLTATVTVAGQYQPPIPPPDPEPEPEPPPGPEPPAGTVVKSIPELKAAIAASEPKVRLAAGRYALQTATAFGANSLWLGGSRSGWDFTRRTGPTSVEMSGVTFDGGARVGRFLMFMEGIADLTFWSPDRSWQWDACSVASDGIVKIGGDPGYAPAHDIRLQGMTFLPTCKGAGPSGQLDHAIYIAHAKGDGPHHITIDDVYADLRGGLDSLIHGYHQTAGAPLAHHVTATRLETDGGAIPIIVDGSEYSAGTGPHDWRIEAVCRNPTKAVTRYLGATGSHDNTISVRYSGSAPARDSGTNTTGVVMDARPI